MVYKVINIILYIKAADMKKKTFSKCRRHNKLRVAKPTVPFWTNNYCLAPPVDTLRVVGNSFLDKPNILHSNGFYMQIR